MIALVLSELLLLNANSSIFQLYHGENKFHFIEMMMRFDLYYMYTNKVSWKNITRADLSLHSDTLNQPVFALTL